MTPARPPLAIYDMDKTVIRRASWTHWLFHFARTEAPWRLAAAPLLALPLAGYALGLLDRKGLKQATQRLMMGRRVPRARVERAAARFAADFGAREELAPALAAMASDRALGRQVWLATASCRYFVEALAARWPVDRVIATENRWDGDALTPEILGENCYEMGKLRMVLAALDARPPQLSFTSDHISDLVLLDWADAPRAANPSSALRQVARQRGWPVCDWAAAAPQAAEQAPPHRPTAPAGSPSPEG
jgi:phosphoserine phosphatase